MSPDAQAPWDAVVVGGGPAGSAAAMALAEAGRRVLLVERRSRVGFKLGESIPPQARPMVARLLGREDETPRHAFPTHGNAACWGSDEPAVRDFFFTPHGHGLRLDRPRFDRALRRRAEELGATVVEGLRVSSLQGTGPFELVLAGDGIEAFAGVHHSRFLLDCSGRSALVARHCGARRHRPDHLFAFARIYRRHPGAGSEDADTYTRIEAAPEGWWYTARLPEGGRLVVFHTDRDLPAARSAARADGFESLLAASRHVGPLLERHGYGSSGPPRGAPGGGERLDRFAGPGWIAAGDAAQAFDPLSSQGIGSALSSGLAAGRAVHRALDGDPRSLSRYARAQEAVHADYQRHHRVFYGSEPRWPDRPFWKRRRDPAAAPAAFGGPS